MNVFKKALVAIACVGTFAGAAQAAPITLAPVTYNAIPNALISGNTVSTFTLDIKDIVNGFRVGVDTLNSAVLSVFLKDDFAFPFDGDEAYKVVLGPVGSPAQTFTGSNLSDSCFLFICGPGSVTEQITLNAAALADLRADGLINIAVSSTFGDFYFDKASLAATVTRGTVPEPTTVALLGLGLLGVAASRRKSTKA